MYNRKFKYVTTYGQRDIDAGITEMCCPLWEYVLWVRVDMKIQPWEQDTKNKGW